MYERIIREALTTPLCLEPRYVAIIRDILRFRASGGRLTAEELEARIDAGPKRSAATPGPTIAVVPIHGVIAHRVFEASSGMLSTDEIGAMLRQAVADPEVDTIVFDTASPGGTVTGVPELADEIYAARKQKHLVALVNGEMASAAYWLGSQAHEVVSIPSGQTGSIGVWTLHEDVSAALDKEGIKLTPISAGDYKLEMAPWAPLTADAKAFLQGQVDSVYKDFTATVARGRGARVADVRSGYGQGRMLDADQALQAGLISSIETIGHLFGRLAKQAATRSSMAARAETSGYIQSYDNLGGTVTTTYSPTVHITSDGSIVESAPDDDSPEGDRLAIAEDDRAARAQAQADLDLAATALAVVESA